MADVGTPKVKCIERILKQISRWVEVDSRVEIWRKDQGADLLEGADWVIGMFVFLTVNLSETIIIIYERLIK